LKEYIEAEAVNIIYVFMAALSLWLFGADSSAGQLIAGACLIKIKSG